MTCMDFWAVTPSSLETALCFRGAKISDPPDDRRGSHEGVYRNEKNGHNSVTIQNRTHVYMNFFDHKDLGNHLLQLCPKVVKHPV
jgi:hypothetical protein